MFVGKENFRLSSRTLLNSDFPEKTLALFQNVLRTYKAVFHQGLSRFSLGSSGLLLLLAVLSEYLSTSTRNAKKIPGNGSTKRQA